MPACLNRINAPVAGNHQFDSFTIVFQSVKSTVSTVLKWTLSDTLAWKLILYRFCSRASQERITSFKGAAFNAQTVPVEGAIDQVITQGSGLGRKLTNGSIVVSGHSLGLQNILSRLMKDRGRWLKRGRSVYKCLQVFGFYLVNLTSFCDEKSASSVDEWRSVDVICLDFRKVFSSNSFP